MHALRGIDWHPIVTTERANRLDVVGVVVGYKQISHRLERDAIVLAIFLQDAYAYTYIYHQSVSGSSEIIAITAATAAKRYKSQHFNVIILCKSTQKKPHRQRNGLRNISFFII
jgi:hypothetical protein